MKFILYNNTFEGFLSAVFDVYELKLAKVHIRKQGISVPELFESPLHSTPEEEKTKRVLIKLKKLVGEEGISKLWKSWLTEEDDVEDCLLGTIQYAISKKADVLSDFGNYHVLQLNQQLKKINREKHRMEAFVRFQLTKDLLYYAVIEPDFNVLPLLIKHFQSRYADQRWLIFDVSRKYGIYYDLFNTEFITMKEDKKLLHHQPDLFQKNEELYQALWKDYFASTNIRSRKNNKLHLQHVPRRYWKYLTEKDR